MRNRFSDAHAIQQGACNPSGVARSLVAAIDQARAELSDTDSVRADPAVRLICHQLAFLLNTAEYDDLRGGAVDAYCRDMAICEERSRVEVQS